MNNLKIVNSHLAALLEVALLNERPAVWHPSTWMVKYGIDRPTGKARFAVEMNSDSTPWNCDYNGGMGLESVPFTPGYLDDEGVSSGSSRFVTCSGRGRYI